MLNNKALILLSLAALVATSCARNVEYFDADLDSYIVNGQPAAPGQFPFAALLKIHMSSWGFEYCTASLIHKQWIMTAGHCVRVGEVEKFEVYLGATNLTDLNEEGRVVAISRESFVHPEFSYQNVQNDVALLKLENPVEFSETVQAVKLSNTTLEAGSKVTTIGFGKLRTQDPSFSKTLQYAEMVHITREECARTYPFLLRREDVICAKGLSKESPCSHDSGGPLVIMENGKPSLVGGTSFGHKRGCDLGIATAFSNTFKFVEWIQETIAAN